MLLPLDLRGLQRPYWHPVLHTVEVPRDEGSALQEERVSWDLMWAFTAGYQGEVESDTGELTTVLGSSENLWGQCCLLGSCCHPSWQPLCSRPGFPNSPYAAALRLPQQPPCSSPAAVSVANFSTVLP